MARQRNAAYAAFLAHLAHFVGVDSAIKHAQAMALPRMQVEVFTSRLFGVPALVLQLDRKPRIVAPIHGIAKAVWRRVGDEALIGRVGFKVRIECYPYFRAWCAYRRDENAPRFICDFLGLFTQQTSTPSIDLMLLMLWRRPSKINCDPFTPLIVVFCIS